MANEISILPFKFKHMSSLLDMHESQRYENMASIDYRTLPKVGYIAFHGTMPVAAGFLRRLEPCYAQIDTLVTAAYCGSVLRHEGVSKVVDALIEEAKSLKIQGLICHTQDKGTLARAEALGFRIVPQTIIALPLTRSDRE